MKPTCGPLPCVMTTRYPSETRAAMWWLVSPAARYWSSTDMCLASLISEFPPMAMTTRGLDMVFP